MWKIIITIYLILYSFFSFTQESNCVNYKNALENPQGVTKICIACSHHDFPLDKECFELPDNFQLFENLKQLKFNEAHFEYLPESINKLPRLKELIINLNMNMNYETELCKIIGLDSLEYLSLQMNGITNLPSCLHQLHSLKGINIGFNPDLNLKNTFKLFSKFDSLSYINLSGFKKRRRFPKSIRKITSVKYLELNYSNRLNLKNTINRLKPLNLKALSLKNCQLTSLPKNLKKLTSIEYLNLSFNEFITIPEQVYQLINLKALIIENNKSYFEDFNQISEKIQNLTQLEILSLQKNYKLDDIKHLEYISNCINLKELYLEGCGYKEIPPSFAKLINLEILEFSGAGNMVSKNNKSRIIILSKLPKLKYLSTYFESIPDEIGMLTELEYLNILGSNINDLPESFFSLKNLKILNIYGIKLKPKCLERIKCEMPNCSVTYNYNFYEQISFR